MKKIMFGILSLLFFCVAINFNYGVTYTSGDYEYEVFLGEAKIVRYLNEKTVNNLVIPSSIDGYTVTSIGEQAFNGYSNLNGTLTIPSTVKSIGHRAFSSCTYLIGNLNIPNSVTSIGDYAFSSCGFSGNLVIPNSVISIGDYAFGYCTGFKGYLTIPNSVTSIGDYAFYRCTGLTGNLNIPNSVTSIGEFAFSSCEGFTGSLTISENLTTIPYGAFYWCTGLTGNLIIPDSVTSIENSAFLNCKGLVGNLIIPENIIRIGGSAFSACINLTGDLVIPDSVKSIGKNAFPTGLTNIPVSNYKYSYYDCNIINNKYITILQYIGPDAVNNITIPSTIDKYEVTGIESSAFMYRSGFTGNLTIPNSVQVIGDCAFKQCSGFTGNLTIPNSVVIIGKQAFSDCEKLTGNLIIPNSVKIIGNYAFENCYSLTGDLIIPNSVTDIGSYAFVGCTGLNGNLVISNSMTNIRTATFAFCTGLTGNLVIPSSVNNIEIGAFGYCIGLTGGLTLPNSVVNIGEEAFYHCIGLTGNLTINNLNTSVGAFAFEGCNNLNIKSLYPMDVTGHWGQNIIAKWIDRGITAGAKATNMYYPDQPILKADLMYTINRLMKYTDKLANISSITDVKSADWYYADTQKAIKAGYIYPMDSTKVYPSSTVTREQFMVMMSRALKLPTANLNVLDKYTDKNKITASIKQEVANYIGAFGFDGNRVNEKLCLIPQNTLTKADTFYFIDKAFDTYDNPPVVNNVANDTINHWSKNIIESLIDRGITASHNITKCFYPDDYILKADLIYTINRMMKFTELATTGEMAKYTDVNSTNWFYADMQKAVKAGYIYPLGENSINPNGTVNREQLFVMISRALNLPTADLSVLDKYTDKDKITASIKQEVANYVGAFGFNGNMVNGKLCLIPQNTLTKADLMYFIYNALPQERVTVLNVNRLLNEADTLNIEVTLSQETLTGDTNPQLSVKIGDGTEVLVDATSLVGNKLTYSYVIPSGASGYVSYKLVGGNLKGTGNLDVAYSKYYLCNLYKVTQEL